MLPLVLFGLAVAALWSVATGRFYIRQARSGRRWWVYGTHHGRLRWHLGSAPTLADALREIERWARR
jgi:hypothetical protein